MMTQQQSQEERFLAMLEGLYGGASADSGLFKKIRAKAWDHFQEIGLPTRKVEVYKYVRLRNLFTKNYTAASPSALSEESVLPFVLPECSRSFFVFVNGMYCEALSCREGLDDKVVAMDLSAAMRTYGQFLTNHWAKAMQVETDPFATLNAALHRGGLFLYVPPQCVVDTPIQVINIVDTGDEASWVLPRLQVFVGKSSDVSIFSTNHFVSGEEYGINKVADFSLDENARAKYVQVVMEERAGVWHFDAVRAALKRCSHFQSVNINDGTYTYRNDYHVTMAQEDADAELDGVWMLSGTRESHANVLIDHQAPHCRSRQLFKGVLRSASRSSFEGKILVRQAAQKTDAFQLNNNLLLDDKAHADSKPNLEIFADDVKASHGATIGKLDAEQLFYLKSRGFSDEDAKNTLIYGYCKDVIDRVSLPSLVQDLKWKAENYVR